MLQLWGSLLVKRVDRRRIPEAGGRRLVEEMAATSFTVAKFLALVAARFGWLLSRLILHDDGDQLVFFTDAISAPE